MANEYDYDDYRKGAAMSGIMISRITGAKAAAMRL